MATCIFCMENPAKLTGEHVYAKWLRHFLPPQPKRHQHRVVQTRFNGDAVERKVVQEYIVKRTKIDVKLPIVCQHCNNGWMSRLQTAVQQIITPMIKGDSKTLDKRSCEILTSWVVMSAMVAEFAAPQALSILQSDRTLLFDCRDGRAELVLANWTIALSRYVGNELDNPHHFHYRNWLSPKTHSQAQTFRLGELVVLAHSGVEQLPGLPELLARAPHQVALVQVYPVPERCVWPPEVWAHDLLMEDIVFRVRKALAQGVREGHAGIVAASENIAKFGSFGQTQ